MGKFGEGSPSRESEKNGVHFILKRILLNLRFEWRIGGFEECI